MRTSKGISTISYNSIPFLTTKLEELKRQRFIDFYIFIYHKAEKDEKKDHIHLYIQPNGVLDTCRLENFFDEFDPTMPDKPLDCKAFFSSKFSDWYLYALHDESYLRSKCLEKKYHYRDTDFYCSDETYFHELLNMCDFKTFKVPQLFMDLVNAGYSFSEILRKNVIPINLISQYKCMYNELVFSDSTSHNIVFDTSTGKRIEGVFDYNQNNRVAR